MALRSPKFGLTAVFSTDKNGERKLLSWNKWINGKTRYVCTAKKAPTPEAADEQYRLRFAELWARRSAGTEETTNPNGGLTVEVVVDHFIGRKRRAGLHEKILGDYQRICDDFIEGVGGARPIKELTPLHFGKLRALWAARFGPHCLYKYISGVREMIKWAADPLRGNLLTGAPSMGDEFELPTKADFRRRRKERREQVGLLEFTPAEIAAQLAAAPADLKAMILLGLNCGFGNTDVANLPWSVVDLEAGVVEYTRSKTYVDRRAHLWPETVAALRAVPSQSPARKEWAGRVFYTRRGHPFVLGMKDQLSMQYRAFLKEIGQLRPGRNFYSLRRTFRTIADAKDSRAADLVMGHVTDADMGGIYVQGIGDDRLRVLSGFVRSAILECRDDQGGTEKPLEAA